MNVLFHLQMFVDVILTASFIHKIPYFFNSVILRTMISSTAGNGRKPINDMQEK